ADRTRLIEPKQKLDHKLDAYSTPIVWKHNGALQLVHHTTSYLCAYDLSTGRELWSWRSPGEQVVATPVAWNDVLVVGGGDAGKCLAAVRLLDRSQHVEPVEVWRARRNLTDLASPVVWDDHVFTVTRQGIATCYEAATGKVKWMERMRGEYHSSITAAD